MGVELKYDAVVCCAERLLSTKKASQLTKQIPAVVDTLYMVMSVPSERIAFLGRGETAMLECTRLTLMLYKSGQQQLYASGSHELLEELNMAAITAQLCWIDLFIQQSRSTTLPDYYAHPLLEPHVWEFCVEQLHTICLVSCSMHLQLQSKPCLNLSGCLDLSGD